ncbi:transcriptional regulator MelR [Edwardsiella piscicida]|uniref:transcriptional regulator MelR n=1 Tax=Edwardsiella piscicida TaxID=1263550 RepID=UPI0002C0BA31|nr:transcriptional regulator MelR [Edwardsiella piscicida]AGH73873.1 DNA-binding transcriptional regulator MelR [Edwardsiella piscicida C07-087]EKS7780250.1 transcriptional regulator MelR [Edwardsiella piscicida]EKS7783291.1 transcriptional regulator MelR [Edwardsiella piscicida]EKS7813270.1 transcriptional regulator MelR [Edwardsiella piscicida]UCQ19646.1 transcriptional regulator MelR [Edwardsiella piscicida]
MEARRRQEAPAELMCNSTDPQPHSPLMLYTEHQRLAIALCPPLAMAASHWHAQVELNIPFDGEIDYRIHDRTLRIPQGHIALFWACTPHRLVDPGRCRSMALLSLPMHLFLAWPLDPQLLSHITHGRVLTSAHPARLTPVEIGRWQQDLQSPCPQMRQLASDEILLMLKRFSLSGWHAMQPGGDDPRAGSGQGLSRHALFYVGQMLTFTAAHYDRALTIEQVARHVGLNAHYAMGLFQRVMQMTLKQYITAMRIHHVRALLSDTDRTVLDIALTAGFSSSSRFYSTFSKYTGMSPQQYRRLARTGATPHSSVD